MEEISNQQESHIEDAPRVVRSKSSGKGCLIGCVVVFIIFQIILVCVVVTVVYNRRTIVAGISQFYLRELKIIDSLTLEEKEKEEARQVVGGLLDAWKEEKFELSELKEGLAHLKYSHEICSLALIALKIEMLKQSFGGEEAFKTKTIGFTEGEQIRFGEASMAFIAALKADKLKREEVDHFWDTVSLAPGSSGLQHSKIEPEQLREILLLMEESTMHLESLDPQPLESSDGFRKLLEALQEFEASLEK
jgi:hypothetical protein